MKTREDMCVPPGTWEKQGSGGDEEHEEQLPEEEGEEGLQAKEGIRLLFSLPPPNQVH